MADEPQVVRGINWRETLPFTHLFRAFRVAIHPSKLVLALLALLCLYLGGRVLDTIWLKLGYGALPNEIDQFRQKEDAEHFIEWRDGRHKELESDYATLITGTAESKIAANEKDWERLRNRDEALKDMREQGRYYVDQVRYALKDHLDKVTAENERRYKDDVKKIEADTTLDKAARQKKLDDLEKDRAELIRVNYAYTARALKTVDGIEGKGLFMAFFQYETVQINNVVRGVLTCNWMGGLEDPTVGAAGKGVVPAVRDFFLAGPGWALRHHWVYFLLFGTLFLLVWSLFGGAITRIAAVHVADEGRKLSVRQGLSFAVSKFLSFLSAPLIPMIILVALGLVIAVGGLLLNIQHGAQVVVGALYILALMVGFVMTLVLLGAAGGFNLMYPTIAVEGSDSFDAISRSFSYVYAKPWKMLFYSAVAITYGSLCYLFVRLFIWLVLLLTWYFINLGVLHVTHAENGGALWPAMMERPDFWSLPYEANYGALGAMGKAGAFLIALWNYLVISMLGAFAISFYFSVNTIIYYLMRREVDATEMDDVYLEQPEEDFTETPVAAATVTAVVTTTESATPPAAEAPAPSPEASQQPSPGDGSGGAPA